MGNIRVDVYREIHKGLRRELCNWVGRIGRLDAENASEVAQARSDFAILSSMLSIHADHEENWVHPKLRACAPDLVPELEHDHKEQDALFEAVEEIFDALKAGASEHPWALQHSLYGKFSEFCGHYLVHMAQEEETAMQLLQDNYSDEELMGLTDEIRGSTPPEDMAGFLSIMIPAMNVEERAAMFGGMKATAPPDVFDNICGLASTVLKGDEWAAVRGRAGI